MPTRHIFTGAERTLGNLLTHHAKARGDSEVFLYEGRRSTYAEFDRRASQVANGLIALGLGKGRRVGYLGKNSDLFYELVFGCARSGTVSVGINWRLAPPEVAYILKDCDAGALFVGPEFYGLVAQTLELMDANITVIAMHGDHTSWPDFTTWRDTQSGTNPGVAVTPDDVAIQMYTSGTTGHPKGVQLTHACFFGLQQHTPNDDMDWNDWNENDVSFVAMPSFHIGGVGYGIWGLYGGARLVIAPDFDPAQALRIIQQEGITKTFMVPAAIRMCVQHPDAAHTDFSKLKYVMYGASPIPLDLLRDALATFQCGFVQLYGMTETTGAATYLPPQDHDVNGNERMRSAGKPYPGVKLKVIDDNNQPVPPRTVGEICIYSPVNMLGYWHLPEATEKTLIDGYVHTGDAGYLDEDGYVYVHDRVKDMIVSGGENVYPAEVESAIFGHPGVSDVAVIGVPDERWGEAVKAVVVRTPGTNASADDIIGWARERIAGYKCPKTVDFIAELPRNPSGKVLKRELRAPYWKGMTRQVN
ncbi:MAG: fatty acid--CoA ligase [Pseudomonadales bacterium]|nr:fatty acid--CoA ligase [Pseudomonadales bacterium]